MQIILSILMFIIGIAVMTVSFKAKEELAYYLTLSVGVVIFFAGIFVIFPKQVGVVLRAAFRQKADWAGTLWGMT